MSEHATLTRQEKELLLKVARETILRTAQGLTAPDFTYDLPVFTEKRGAFVTLHKEDELRGCIGYVQPYKPLLAAIIEMAEAASRRDPRFTPVAAHEVAELDIEISVLSPLQQISAPEEISVGVHGILIELGHHAGLLLPQVATEYGWDRTTFLEHSCRKAGVSVDAWQDPKAKIYIFSAQVFSEKGLGLRG